MRSQRVLWVSLRRQTTLSLHLVEIIVGGACMQRSHSWKRHMGDKPVPLYVWLWYMAMRT